ncbi:MAG TPA: pyruvate kinase [Candidatus Baltobacteraceae bacterium]|nr:pyruvate kinase [Candidatus Baltobacteraceae bacterium]
MLAKLRSMRDDVAREGQTRFDGWRPRIRRDEFSSAALNLAHYLAFRRRDLRDVQRELTGLGLSSLGRCESRVLPTLDAVLAALAAICGEAHAHFPEQTEFFAGETHLASETDAVFGPPPSPRRVRIMVTLPSEAATDPLLVRALVEQGMDCARINCAHDDQLAWQAMIDNVRRAAESAGRPCRIAMDIAGPKIRTAAVEAPESHALRGGDSFLLARCAGDGKGNGVRVTCTLPEVFESLRVGDPVWVDDGRIGSHVEHIDADGATLRVTHARTKGEHIKVDKGLNFPSTELHISPLTTDDMRALDFVATHADIVGYSFVAAPRDVERLQTELVRRNPEGHCPAIMLKIETARAVRALPELIVQAASLQPAAVMIARGDLQVEIGPLRMAEIQEEVLWVCEAAGIPVVWATQVLDRLVRKGIASRAELTDAAMGERAECVMLNKGPFLREGVKLLDAVLEEMEAHQFKKTAQLRALHSW